MFNDKYCLTQAVLDGTKTMTRRKLTLTLDKDVDGKLIRVYPSKVFFDNGKWLFDYDGKTYFLPKENYPAYKVGEVVAVAQPYKKIVNSMAEYRDIILDNNGNPAKEYKAGWNNKLFVGATLMPHHIRITDIKIERLQDISKEDCLKEGIIFIESLSIIGYDAYFFAVKPKSRQIYGNTLKFFSSPQRAYADLIDKISGKGTWESNPWVVAYSFELVD